MSKHRLFLKFIAGIICALFFISGAVVLSTCTRYAFCTDIPPKANIISAYQVDLEYAELNKTYTRGAGIDMNQSDFYRAVLYSDIPDIAELSGVTDVYLYDESYVADAIKSLSDGTMPRMALAVPNDIYNSYINETTLPYRAERLISGRLPKDGKGEVCLSAAMLRDIYHKTSDNAIGSTILYQGDEYTVCGITEDDMYYFSYAPDKSYGIYRYAKETYENFYSTNHAYKLVNKYAHASNADNVFIYTSEGAERDVLNTMMMHYPAENYNSNVFCKVFKAQYNTNVQSKLTLYAVIASVLTGAVFALCLIVSETCAPQLVGFALITPACVCLAIGILILIEPSTMVFCAPIVALGGVAFLGTWIVACLINSVLKRAKQNALSDGNDTQE